MTRAAVTAVLALALALAAPAARADYLITFTGTYSDSVYQSYRFDGVDEFFDDLPPLLALDRLAGGTFTASFRVPDAAAAPRPGTGRASFPVPDPGGLTYTLFDHAGAVVHRGTNPTRASVTVENDVPAYGSAGTADRLSFDSFVNDVSGLVTPPPDPLYTSIGPPAVFSDAFVAFEQDAPPGDILTDLSVPLDPATYARFPADLAGSRFVVRLSYDDGDYFDFVGPNRYVFTAGGYEVTGVSVQAVPEPASAVLLAAGGLGLLGYARRRRAAA